MKHNEQESVLVNQAVQGNQEALEAILSSVQDMVYNLSLRMLGLPQDAQDASQEILIRVMTHLSSFRGQSSLSTWVFRIAVNYLKNYKKGMFAKACLSFEEYGADIASGRERDIPDNSGGVDRGLLEQELKLSCTNVMLQCLDPQSRCIYILGTMFRLDSRIAAEILDMTPEAYRQRLSRTRKRMAAFLAEYCGLSKTGMCSCKKRVDYAVATHRIDPAHLNFQEMEPCRMEDIVQRTDAMEHLDGLSQIFAQFPAYRSPQAVRDSVSALIGSRSFQTVLAQEVSE